MSLKTLPIRYRGELHQVRLINFSVDLAEVRPLVPAPLKVRELESLPGRALISMVDVQLRNMRVAGLPKILGFDYRHIGFRLLIEDHRFPTNEGQNRGIFFLQSFTDKRWVALAGSWLTYYRLQPARFRKAPESLSFTAEVSDAVGTSTRHTSYALDFTRPASRSALLPVVGLIDRAYAVENGRVFRTRIMRERWPLEPVHLADFKTDWFATARPETAFYVPETIPYIWQPPTPIALPN